MRCPFCHGMDTQVVDSRLASEGEQIRRRRACLNCQERFTTYETAELAFPRMIKRDESREAFDEQKLRQGLLRALEKRPVSTALIDKSITHIKQKLRAMGEKELRTQVLGEWIMYELKDIDHVAYVRFASVYRRFEDVEAFEAEIKRLREEALQEL